MKLIIFGITSFFLCNAICAQCFSSYNQYSKTNFSEKLHQANSILYAENLFTDKSFSKDSKLKNVFMGSISTTPYLFAALPQNTSSWDKDLKVNMKTRTLISAGLFIPTIASGYFMRGSNGNPKDGLLAIHKLSTVSNLILLDATVLKKRKTASVSWIESFIAITMNVSFVATITTGGLQSVNKSVPGWVNTSHQITPWVTVLSSGTLLYLLNK